MLADPALHAFIGGEPASEAELRERFTRQAAGHSPDGAQGWLNWVARDRATRAPVGTVQATITDDAGGRAAALAWVVATSRQGEGLATEAAARRDGVAARARRQRASPPTSIPTTAPPPRSRGTSASRRPTSAATARSAGWGPRRGFSAGVPGAARPTGASREREWRRSRRPPLSVTAEVLHASRASRNASRRRRQGVAPLVHLRDVFPRPPPGFPGMVLRKPHGSCSKARDRGRRAAPRSPPAPSPR